MKKKILALTLVLALAAATLGACAGSSSPSSTGTSDGSGAAGSEAPRGEPITLTVYSQLANYNGEITGWSAQLLLEKFNVKLLIIDDQDGVYETRMEAGDLGDIVVWGSAGKQYINAMKQGLLWDWDDEDLLAEYGSYILENMPIALENNRDLTEREMGTRELYGFGFDVAPTADDIDTFLYSWDLRWDIYAELGYPSMKNLDEFADVLEQMRDHVKVDDNGNPIYAVSLWPDWDGSMVMYVKSTATAYYGYDELELGLYDPDTGDYYPALEEGGPYLKMLAFYNDLYRRGLIDPDSMTNTWDTMAAKLENGGTLFSIFNYSGSERYNTTDHLDANKIMLSCAPDEARPIVYGLNVFGGNRIWTIGAKTQYPELCMELINWLCTPEGRLTTDYGPKGVTWDYDENGKTYFTELGLKTNNDRNSEMEAPYSGKFGDGFMQINNTTWTNMALNPESGEPYNHRFWASYSTEPRNASETDWRAKTGANSVHEYMVNRPAGYTVSPGSTYKETPKSTELTNTWEQVTTCIVKGSWRAIYANTPEEFQDIVTEMINDARAYGYAECEAWSFNEAALRKAKEDEIR